MNPSDITHTLATQSAFPSGSILLWGLLGILVLYAIIHASVFWYHWNRYNIASPSFERMTILTYFSGTIVLLAVALISLLILLP